jgi:hypothetical protein
MTSTIRIQLNDRSGSFADAARTNRMIEVIVSETISVGESHDNTAAGPPLAVPEAPPN